MTSSPSTLDGTLVTWGERLFYPANRIVKTSPAPHLGTLAHRAAAIRSRIVATVRQRAPQVMVKVTGGGRGMLAIAAHLRYISRDGRLPVEDDRGVVQRGRDALHDIAEQWRYAGSVIPQEGHRREALNIMLSMPQGTDPSIVQRAAREFAAAELRGHRYVMVLHDHQANPHVHLSVRSTRWDGTRLNPRKADLHRWRETFAEKLRGWGIEAEASRQATRGEHRRHDTLWRIKAREVGRLRSPSSTHKAGDKLLLNRRDAVVAWIHVAQALQQSGHVDDQALARDIQRFLADMPIVRERQRAARADHRATSREAAPRQRDLDTGQSPAKTVARPPGITRGPSRHIEVQR